MNTPRLIQERQLNAGEHVRIWQEPSGRFMFEHLKPAGRWVTINCDSLEEAIALLKRIEKINLSIRSDIQEE